MDRNFYGGEHRVCEGDTLIKEGPNGSQREECTCSLIIFHLNKARPKYMSVLGPENTLFIEYMKGKKKKKRE